MSRAEFIAFRKSLGRTPPLERMSVRVRGVALAVWSSPFVAGVPPLLLVNGGLLYDHALLWPALSPLAAGRQVILYDQRGRGESEAPPDPSTARIEDDADDMPALRRALGIRQWDVLGHSWGGGIALLGVARDRAGTRRLVTVDAVGPTSAWMPRLHANAVERATPGMRAALDELGRALTNPDPAKQSAYAGAMYPAWFADPDFATYFVPPEAASITGAAVLARLRRDGYDWRSQFQDFSTSTLLVHGREDPLPNDIIGQWTSLIPRSASVMLDHAGHMPFWEAPRAFFQEVSAFLGR